MLTTPTTDQPSHLALDRRARSAPQRLSRLFTVELRKTVDTRAGRMMVASVILLSLAITIWGAADPWDRTIEFSDFVEATTLPVVLLLPVVGVLAMTSEWTQRTALTTFTLSPRRIRVLLCKLAASILIGLITTAAAVTMAVAGVATVGTVHADTTTSFSDLGGATISVFVAITLSTVMGAAFGALISVTPAALVAYFAAPLIWNQVGGAILGRGARWFDITTATQNVAQRNLDGVWPQTITSIAGWIVIPLIAGLFVSARREVK